MMGYFELKTAKDGQVYWNLKASNHKVILTSDLYMTRIAAKNSIESVQSNCTDRDQFEKHQSKNGRPLFVLKAKNGQEIGRSVTYGSNTSCEEAIKLVQLNGKTTEIKGV